MRALSVLVALALLALPAAAQDVEECAPATTDFSLTMSDTSAPTTTEMTDAEVRVQARIAGEGVHVVHFWAPWCDNSLNELHAGWKELVEKHDDVTFTFVTVWNDGEDGRETLQEYGLDGERVLELTQADFGPKDDKSLRRKTFLGLPMTWIPSTWIFHDGGKLAFALNYGEMTMDTLSELIRATRHDW